jgi:UDP-N-acetylmuramoyl-tripeptide--D-alanyl-D-alanine ligase
MIQSIGSHELYQVFEKHPHLTIDSRKIEPGCIFFALRGDSFDGNTFATESLRLGASYAVIDNPAFQTENTLLVPDVLVALQDIARIHRSKLQIPIIGITGTNGKTTTKELVNSVLSSQYNVLATCGNLNNHIGVPLTLLSVTKSTEIAIIEMGANHQGEIAFLCEIARPTHGLITNIGKAHLEGFGGFEGVIKTKNELYHYLDKTNGIAFVNGDNDLLTDLSSGLNRILYGQQPEFQTFAGLAESDPFLGVSWKRNNTSTPIRTQLVGSYNLENVNAALSVATYFNIPDNKVIQALSNYSPSNNRSQKVKTETNLVILDAYNANPSSMHAAISNFSSLKAPRKMVILGDMLELGAESAAEHLAIVGMVRENDFTDAIFVGPEFQKAANGKFQAFLDVDAAVEWLKHQPIHEFTILVKGSRGIKMEKVMEVL